MKDSISIRSILEDNTTHYERTCNFCGNTWLGLHCPHDGYQNPCPNCDRKPPVIDYFDCKCVGVTDIEEASAQLLQLLESKAETYEDGDDNGGEHLAVPLSALGIKE